MVQHRVASGFTVAANVHLFNDVAPRTKKVLLIWLEDSVNAEDQVKVEIEEEIKEECKYIQGAVEQETDADHLPRQRNGRSRSRYCSVPLLNTNLAFPQKSLGKSILIPNGKSFSLPKACSLGISLSIPPTHCHHPPLPSLLPSTTTTKRTRWANPFQHILSKSLPIYTMIIVELDERRPLGPNPCCPACCYCDHLQ